MFDRAQLCLNSDSTYQACVQEKAHFELNQSSVLNSNKKKLLLEQKSKQIKTMQEANVDKINDLLCHISDSFVVPQQVKSDELIKHRLRKTKDISCQYESPQKKREKKNGAKSCLTQQDTAENVGRPRKKPAKMSQDDEAKIDISD